MKKIQKVVTVFFITRATHILLNLLRNTLNYKNFCRLKEKTIICAE